MKTDEKTKTYGYYDLGLGDNTILSGTRKEMTVNKNSHYITASEEYTAAKLKNVAKVQKIVRTMTIIEILMFLCVGFIINSFDLRKRASREYEIRNHGYVSVDTGRYFGETDFGYFTGSGEFDFEEVSFFV